MAPKKAAASEKDKAPMMAGEPAAAQQEGKLKAALLETRIGSPGVDKVRQLAAAASNEHGATKMKPFGSVGKLREGYYPIFLHTLSAGLVPPSSDFLMAILGRF